MRQYSRRQFLEVAAAGSGAFAAACNLDTAAPQTFTHADALIAARPGTPTVAPVVGYSALGIQTGRDGQIYVPTTYSPSTPAPLILMLHGGGGAGLDWKSYGMGELLDDLGIVIVAPDSRGITWDLFTRGGYQVDPRFFNLAMEKAFAQCNIDPTRVAIAGFSDGATESIGVGIANGDLFSHIIAWSPGKLVAPFLQGKPKLFISHGETDQVLSFAYDRDFIVPPLSNALYDVTFVPFDAGHELPTAIARQAAQWFLS